jgi:hypothetical protein
MTSFVAMFLSGASKHVLLLLDLYNSSYPNISIFVLNIGWLATQSNTINRPHPCHVHRLHP